MAPPAKPWEPHSKPDRSMASAAPSVVAWYKSAIRNKLKPGQLGVADYGVADYAAVGVARGYPQQSELAGLVTPENQQGWGQSTVST